MSLLSSLESLLTPEVTGESLIEVWYPPTKVVNITVTADDKGEALKEKKEKLKARTASKMGYRDLVMSTEGISLNIVENAVSKELTKGDLKKA